MGIRVSVSFTGKLKRSLALLAIPSQGAANSAASSMANEILLNTKIRTPTMTGRARSAWVLTVSGSTFKVFKIENDVAYINVLEYGGYPVRPNTKGSSGGFVRGKGRLGGKPPGPKTTRPSAFRIPKGPFVDIDRALPVGRVLNANVSSSARKGMLRISMANAENGRFRALLELHLKNVFRRFR